MTKAVLGMLCYDKPSVLEIRISQIKAKLSLLLLTWSLAKPRTESTQTLGQNTDVSSEESVPSTARPSKLDDFLNDQAWNVFFFVCQKLAVYNSSHNSICVDCRPSNQVVFFTLATRHSGRCWRGNLNKSPFKADDRRKIKKKRRRRRKSTYSKSLNYRFHFLRVQQMGKKAKLQRQKMNINTCYQR